MNQYPILTTPCVLLLLICLAPVPLTFSGESDPQPQSTAVERPEDVRIRYAEVKLELAKVELQLLLDANKKMPVISQPLIERKRANIRVAEELVRAARRTSESGDATQIHLVDAKEESDLAKRRYMKALELKDREVVYSDLEMKQLQLLAESAQLRLEIWNDPRQTLSLIQHMQWQIERLSEEVLDLRKAMAEKNH